MDRYRVERAWTSWLVQDTNNGQTLLRIRDNFPDAEFMARTQCAFLNESPAMQSS